MNGQLQMKAGETFVAGESGTVDVTVTETAADGTTSTEVVSVDVSQVESSRTETLNEQAVAENPTVVAATVDTSEGSTYSASDERFEVVNGQLQMKAGETFVAGESGTVDVTVTETAADGTTSTEVVSVDVSRVENSRTETLNEQAVAENPTVVAATVDTSEGSTYSASDERFEVVNGQLQMKAGETFVAGESGTVDVTVTETAADGTVTTEVVSVDVDQVKESRTETLNEQAVAENPTVVAATVDTSEGSTYSASDERFEVVNGQLQMKAGETFVAGESGTVDVTVSETAADGTVTTEVVSVDVDQVKESRAETLNEQAVAENPTVVAATVDTDEGSTYTASDERFEVVNGQLQMKAGETFVAGESGTVDVTVTETAADGTVTTEVVSVDVDQVKESRTETLNEQAVAENPTVVAATVDTDEGSTYTASDERFEVVNGQLQMKAGETFVAGESDTVDVTVTETAADGTVSSEVVSVDIDTVDASRTNTQAIDNELSSPSVIAGNVNVESGTTYTASDNRFEVVNGNLRIKAGAEFVAGETSPFVVEVKGVDGSNNETSQSVSVDIAQIAEAREALTSPAVVAGTVPVAEGHEYSTSDSRFEMVDGQLQLKAGEDFVVGETGTIAVAVTGTNSANETVEHTVQVDVEAVKASRHEEALPAVGIEPVQTGFRKHIHHIG